MTIPHQSERCQIKHQHEGCEAQCQNRHKAKVRDKYTGDTYRVCTKHLRMSLEGKVGPFGKTIRHQEIQHWRRHGSPSPHLNRYEERKQKWQA